MYPFNLISLTIVAQEKPFVMHLFILFLLFSLVTFTSSLPHHRLPPLTTPTLTSSLSFPHAPPPPTVFFEVTKPINHPPTTPCSHLILQHDFAYTYGTPPVITPYAPPSHCPFTTFSTAVLEWSATCQGRQFDRIFGVWLGGVELLRSCTAEPTINGIFWKVEKDITKFTSLLNSNNTLSVYLANLIDKTYTGVYHVNITIHYYPPGVRVGVGKLGSGYEKFADLILPVSRDSPLNDGLWFEIENSTDYQSQEVVIPKNVYRAVLEVYISYHENDEFWYSNFPNDYLLANNMTAPGNGPFREVLVSLDGDLVGAVWPFTVIYTGGVNPLLWRPISGIGSFDLPTYDIEITPYLGKLLDGKAHEFGFSVTNALNVWYIDANLHLWLDENSKQTKGRFLENNAETLAFSSSSEFSRLNGKFHTRASRSLLSKGWVKSSYGNITTTSIQRFHYKNSMVLKKDGNLQIVNQTIGFNSSVSANLLSSTSPLYKSESQKLFPVFLYTDEVDQGSGTYTLITNVTLGFNEDKILESGSEVSSSSLRNKEKGNGIMDVKNNLVVRGLGSTHQVYKYEEDSGKFCYHRNVSSSNYTILYDQVSDKCTSGSGNHVSNLSNIYYLIE